MDDEAKDYLNVFSKDIKRTVKNTDEYFLNYLLDDDLKRSDIQTLLGGVINDEVLWSCTTCGACEEECPVMIEYVNKVVDLRRGLVLEENRYPDELINAFKSLGKHEPP